MIKINTALYFNNLQYPGGSKFNLLITQNDQIDNHLSCLISKIIVKQYRNNWIQRKYNVHTT